MSDPSPQPESFPIIDAHHHFWNIERNYHPWLRDEPPIPFRYGDYSALKRTYLKADYDRDTESFEIAGSVYVEAEWDPRDPLGETRWVHEIAAQCGLPSAMVAQAWLDRDDVEAVLQAQASMPLVRSIRHKPKAAPSPDLVAPDVPGSMSDPHWRRGFAMLEELGLAFDLQTPWWQLREAAELAEAYPTTQIILNHTGLPSDRSPLDGGEDGLKGWRQAMATIALCPNIAVKISGLGVPGQPWTADANRRIVLETIELFGADRCMFASNFPVDGLCATFKEIFDGFMAITAEFDESDRRRLFHDNARHYYRLEL